MIDLSGTEVASYVYDSWGNIKDTKGEPTIREINPIRYRSYVYDEETGLYYLQSRYYDPLTGRFLNADTNLNSNILGLNVYIYIAITTLLIIWIEMVFSLYGHRLYVVMQKILSFINGLLKLHKRANFQSCFI